MKISKTKFKGLNVLNGIKFNDSRGYFREVYLEKLFKKKKIYILVYVKIKKKCFERHAYTD